MNLWNVLRLVSGRVVGRIRNYRVFRYMPAQGSGIFYDNVRIYDVSCPPPEAVLKSYRLSGGSIFPWIMMNRLRRKGAVLLLILDDEQQVEGFGWLQSMKLQNREFWWLSGEGICLGPYWTHPHSRGQGIYGRLLKHSLHVCHQKGWMELYIWADASNQASIRGIEKAGFESLGNHRISQYLCGVIRRHHPLDKE